ncbi:hypothetical protein D3C80_1780740 [compost metagenome]
MALTVPDILPAASSPVAKAFARFAGSERILALMSSVEPAVPFTSTRPSPVMIVRPEMRAVPFSIAIVLGFSSRTAMPLGAAEKASSRTVIGDPAVLALPFTTSGALS